MVLPKKSCRCEAPGCFGYTMGSSGARWLGRQSVKKVLARSARGRQDFDDEQRSQDDDQPGSALGLPLSVRDPARPAGLPIPPCCRRILRYSLNLNGAITVRSWRELRAVGIATASARREPRSDRGEARTPRGRYRTRRWIGNRSSPVDVSNPSHALHGMPPSAQPGADRRPRISAGRQRSSPHAPITGAAGRRNRVKIAAAMMVRHHANKGALHLQLRRIEGQVRGIQRMVQDEAGCIEASHRSPRSPVL